MAAPAALQLWKNVAKAKIKEAILEVTGG